jgi:hypothetical protein
MSMAGVIVYKINADWTLDGRGNHPQLAAGKVALERASSGGGSFVGDRDVHIYGVGGEEISAGILTISAARDAYSFSWRVSRGSTTVAQVFTGVGFVDGDSLVACWQEEEPTPSPS